MKQLSHQFSGSRHDARIARGVKVAILLFGLTWGARFDAAMAAPPDATPNRSPAIAADFQRELRPPSSADSFLRPRGLFVDRKAHEVFVSDSGNSRVLIFGEKGVLRFQFSTLPYCTSPSSLVVDGDGYIYVAGSSLEGRKIFRFDFDGLFLEAVVPFETDAEGHDHYLVPSSLAVNSRNHLYTIDQKTGRMLCLDAKGKVQSAFSLVEGMDPKSARELVFGSISVVRNRLYVPYSSLGMVGVFDLDGQRLDSVGHMGDEAGGLNFPVAVAVTDRGEVLVLDNNRYNVVCYDASGRFVQEFGGKGYRLGWFYHPTLIAIDSLEQVYVGQIFQNWIQVCDLPPLLRINQSRIPGGNFPASTHDPSTQSQLVHLTLESHPAFTGSSGSTPVTSGNSKENP
jgi:DNA-binding beta-propeller fold protein YncE